MNLSFEILEEEFVGATRARGWTTLGQPGGPGRWLGRLLVWPFYGSLALSAASPVLIWLGTGSPLSLAAAVVPGALGWTLFKHFSSRRPREQWRRFVSGTTVTAALGPDGAVYEGAYERAAFRWAAVAVYERPGILKIHLGDRALVVPARAVSAEQRARIAAWVTAARAEAALGPAGG